MNETNSMTTKKVDVYQDHIQDMFRYRVITFRYRVITRNVNTKSDAD